MDFLQAQVTPSRDAEVKLDRCHTALEKFSAEVADLLQLIKNDSQPSDWVIQARTDKVVHVDWKTEKIL